ncbi:MAG TPA: rod shape-determining protein MreC [Acidobacteriota bacterium]|jgi:rod shape-determining protein MreC
MIFNVQKRPLLNFVLLLILNVFLLSIQLRSPGGQTFLKIWMLSVASPVMASTSYVAGRGFRLWGDYVNLIGTHRQNQRLTQENQRLRMELRRLEELGRMQVRIAEYQKFQEQFQYTTRMARVIAKSPPFWKFTILVNAGSNDGVQPNSAVIAPGGIVGRVLNTTPRTSEVELINNAGAGAGVFVGGNRVQGIAQGGGSEVLGVRFVSNQENIRSGDSVITSGTDRIYPPGLPVGRVSAARNSNHIFKEITLKPAVNLSLLEEVLVITGYKYSAPPPAEVAQKKKEVQTKLEPKGGKPERVKKAEVGRPGGVGRQ